MYFSVNQIDNLKSSKKKESQTFRLPWLQIISDTSTNEQIHQSYCLLSIYSAGFAKKPPLPLHTTRYVCIQYMHSSMTSLFVLTVAQPTKWRFLLKNLSALVIFVIELVFT